MKIIYNNIIPFRGFAAINLFGVLFVRKGVVVNDKMLNHERIHTAQIKECLYIFFYIWYVLEWLIRLMLYANAHKAYRNISFEQEAYNHEADPYYLPFNRGKYYRWIYYLTTTSYHGK